MPPDDVKRLTDLVNNVLLKLERMDEKLKSYPALLEKVADLDKKADEQAQYCKFVQGAKTKISWGQIISTLISLILGGTLTWFVQQVIK